MNEYRLQYLILFGKTGSGKSEILNCLQKRGEQVLDLEYLAAHHGSAFGGIESQQPVQEEFERQITEKLKTFNADKPVWVEYESTYLGRLQIPTFVLQGMNAGKMVILEVPKEKRIQRLVRTYARYPKEKLLEALSKVKSKFSLRKYRFVRRCIRENDFDTAVSAVLSYYDRIYENGLKKTGCEIIAKIDLKGETVEDDCSIVQAYVYKSRV